MVNYNQHVELYVNGMDEVGVLYSPGFGAGWSTWKREYDGSESIELFDTSNYICF